MNTVDISIDDFKDVSMNDIKKEYEHAQWNCCSGTRADSRLVRFLAIYVILLMVFVFCLERLYHSETCEDTTGYMALLTLLLGLVVPTPK